MWSSNVSGCFEVEEHLTELQSVDQTFLEHNTFFQTRKPTLDILSNEQRCRKEIYFLRQDVLAHCITVLLKLNAESFQTLDSNNSSC